MTTRHLDCMFHPASVAVIGASQQPGSVGAVVTRNLFGAGFVGEIFPVTPHYATIEGVRTYLDIASLPTVPDLAVIATPPETVPGVIAALGQRGTKAAVVLTARGREETNDYRAWQTAMLEAARPHLLRIMGPNCLGIMVPGGKLNASVGHIQPLPGGLAFVAQSGAVLTSVLDWATARRVGFSHLVSFGYMVDVEVGDMLDYLATEPHARAILLSIEAITQARKFMSAARAAARMKPVVVVKAGRFAEDVQEATSHTGALGGADAVYDAAFRRAGMLRVTDVQALFDVVETLAMLRPFPGDRLAIVTNSGSIGELAADALIERSGRLAQLSPATLQRLHTLLPPTGSYGNPVDIGDDAPASRYAEVIEALFNDREVGAMVVLNCPTAIACRAEAVQAVIETMKKQGMKARTRGLFTCWLGEQTAGAARKALTDNSIPTYPTPEEAVRACMQMVRYRQSQEMLMEVPPTIPEMFTPDTAQALHMVEKALAEERSWLAEHEAKAVLAAYGVPVATTQMARTPEEAAQLAADVRGPVALKILSPDITHKTEVGGVALDLETPEAVREAARAMLTLVRHARPEIRIAGWTVQPMAQWPHAHALRIGMIDAPPFGPVLVFGPGGTATEVSQDAVLALPPLNMHLARDVISRTKTSRLLEGNGRMPAADLEAIALTLVKVSQLTCDIAEIAALDINPLLASKQGVMALDARMQVVRSLVPASERLAIRPYPKALEETLTLPDGTTMLLRPIRPEDEPAYQALFHQLPMEEIRRRFFRPMKLLSHELAARLTQIDYDREMALVLAGTAASGEAEVYGEVRMSADPNKEQAEFAILLRRDMTGKGLGPLLLRRIIDYARAQGIGEIYGEVLSDNRAMLKLCQAFGFALKAVPNDPGVIRATLPL